jgi:hypothetical protein
MAHYWNSRFEIKSSSRLQRSGIKRSKPMKRTVMNRSARPINKIGKKSKQWIAVRRRLKVEFEALGITSCELRYEGCAGDGMLGFAHGRKRRHLKGDELETLTILACNHCHDAIEYLGPEKMLEIVEHTIARRSERRAA